MGLRATTGTGGVNMKFNEAVNRLKEAFGWHHVNLAGLSGGGHLVAALIARRMDVGLAVIASGNVAVAQRNQERGRVRTDFPAFVS